MDPPLFITIRILVRSSDKVMHSSLDRVFKKLRWKYWEMVLVSENKLNWMRVGKREMDGKTQYRGYWTFPNSERMNEVFVGESDKGE